jgi:1,4-alpha-glucan branching enzyme
MIQVFETGWVCFVFEHAVEQPVFLVGDFNDWDETSHRMEHQPNGTHRLLLRLESGGYEFKYKSGSTWFNDSEAHAYVQNCWGTENSVVYVPPSVGIAQEDRTELPHKSRPAARTA